MTAIQTLTGTLAVDSRFRGNDDIHGGRAQHRHSRESGNPHLLSEPQPGDDWALGVRQETVLPSLSDA